jgi:ABC-type dipeptide/oligopeptide/nickel transport system permease subunit
VAETHTREVIRLNAERERNHVSQSLTQKALGRLWRDKLTMAALFVLLIISLLVVFADPITRYVLNTSPTATNPSMRLLPPFQNPQHILGTDDLGRDFAARLLYGGQVSLAIGFFGSIITLVIGAAIGLIAGYFGGLADDLINWVITTLDSIPSIYLLLLLSTALSESNAALVQSGFILILVVSLTGWTGDARLVRGQTIQIRNLDYVLSAQALGASSWRIMWVHIFPNTLSLQFLVLASSIGGLILAESTLSFLNLGIKPPTATWGNMLTNAQQFFSRGPHMATMSGLLIFVTVLCLYIIGDGLRDAFDPRSTK